MYKDRGIIKWAPFDALKGFKESINYYEYEKSKINKPILMPDKLEELDYTFQNALHNNLEIEIVYYEDGFLKNLYGTIKKIDNLNKTITLNNNITIKSKDILNIDII